MSSNFTRTYFYNLYEIYISFQSLCNFVWSGGFISSVCVSQFRYTDLWHFLIDVVTDKSLSSGRAIADIVKEILCHSCMGS